MKLITTISILFSLLLTACGGNSNSNLIGPAGGEVISDDGLLKLIIPENALNTNTNISITHDPVTTDNLRAGVYNLEPSGTSFARPVSIELLLENHSDNAIEFTPVLMLLESSGMIEIINNQTNTLKSKDLFLTGELSHFSRLIWKEESGLRWRGTEPPKTWQRGEGFTTTMSLSSNGSDLSGNVYAYQENLTPLFPSITINANLIDANTSFVEVFANEIIRQDDSFVGFLNSESTLGQVFTKELTSVCSDTQTGLGTYAPRISLFEYELKSGVLENFFILLSTGGAPGGLQNIDLSNIPTGILFRMGIERGVTCIDATPNEDTITEVGTVEVTADPDPINAVHQFGVSNCPQQIGTITITNNSNNTVPIDINIPTGAALSVDPTSGDIFPGQSVTLMVYFTCADINGVNNVFTVNGKTTGVIVTVEGAPE